MSATAEAPRASYVQEFGHRLGKLRHERGLTEREAAFASGTGQSHIKQLEQGRQPPLLTTVYKLAVGLEVTPLWLAFGDDADTPERARVEYEERKVRTAFYRRAKFARLARGLTQRELAERLGIDQGNVSAIERGVQGPTLGTLHAYCEALDLPPAWLMDTAEEVAPWEA